MSNYTPSPNPTPPPYNPQPQPPAYYGPPLQPPVKKKRKWILPVGMLVGGLILGSTAGASQVPDPIVETKTETKTVTETKEVTPKECLKALDLYEELVGYSTEALGYTKEAMLAASKLDAAGIRAENDKMTELKPKIQAVTDPLLTAKSTCRASAE